MVNNVMLQANLWKLFPKHFWQYITTGLLRKYLRSTSTLLYAAFVYLSRTAIPDTPTKYIKVPLAWCATPDIALSFFTVADRTSSKFQAGGGFYQKASSLKSLLLPLCSKSPFLFVRLEPQM